MADFEVFSSASTGIKIDGSMRTVTTSAGISQSGGESETACVGGPWREAVTNW